MRAAPLLFAILLSMPAHADQGPEVSAERDSVQFAKLVDAGDRARRARQYSTAITSYSEALDIRSDPAVNGRLGLVLLEIGEHAAAAEHLLQAITKAQASAGLMQQFHAGFARVRPKVCFVEVFVSEGAANIEIDGELEPTSDHNAFHVFVTGGQHTFRAKLEGFEDATETVDAPAGGELQVRLNLKALPPAPPPPPPVQVAPVPNPEPILPVVVKPANRLSDSYAHFYLGAGAVFVVGATPGGALGPQITGGIRRGFFSVNVDALFAFSLATPDRAPDLQIMTWAITLRPCAHHTFLFGCGLVQVDGLQSLSENSENFVHQARLGGGVRGGVQLVLRKRVLLQLWGEGTVHGNGYDVVRDGGVVWRGLPMIGGFGATTFLTW